MYDAIVVGARCAGSPTAMLLARQGYRVLLVDKARFPSDTLSVHYIHQPGVACLAALGPARPGRRLQLPARPAAAPGLRPLRAGGRPAARSDGVADGYAPRRTVLDKILVEAAVAAGAEVRERFTVDELVMDGERVTGIRGHAAGGATVTEAGAHRHRRRRPALAGRPPRRGADLRRPARLHLRLLQLLERRPGAGRRALRAAGAG